MKIKSNQESALSVSPQNLAVVVPALSVRFPNMEDAIEQAGHEVFTAESLACLGQIVPAVIVVNVEGFGDPDNWPSGLIATVRDKVKGSLALVPMLVIDPPNDVEWNMVGGLTRGVDAYLRWTGDADELAHWLHRITERKR